MTGYRDYYWYKEHHICVRCRNNKADVGRTCCAQCREEDNAYHNDRYNYMTKQQKERRSASNKELYAKRKAAGVCVSCGKRKAEAGKTRCTECAEKGRKACKRYYMRKVR